MPIDCVLIKVNRETKPFVKVDTGIKNIPEQLLNLWINASEITGVDTEEAPAPKIHKGPCIFLKSK